MAVHFDEQSFNEALKNNKLVVADFFAVWCQPCKMLGPVIEKLAEEYDGKVIIGKVNVEECAALAEKYDVMSVPTIHFFKDGELVETLNGYKPSSEIKSVIDRLI